MSVLLPNIEDLCQLSRCVLRVVKIFAIFVSYFKLNVTLTPDSFCYEVVSFILCYKHNVL
jgi:hypothetical protein